MATFQIHEDVENVDENQNRNVKKVDPVVREISRKRSAFQAVNLVNPEPKRIKINELKAGNGHVHLISITNNQKVEKAERKEEKVEKNLAENVDKILKLECVELRDENENCFLETPEKLENKEKELFPFELSHNIEYVNDILSYLKHAETVYERPNPCYMRRQKDLDGDMRTVLVDWLISVTDEYKLSEETLHLSINYIDRFLSKMSVVRDKFQLLGSVAMKLASKMEEIYPPETKEWLYLSGSVYTTQQFYKMEQLLLKVLKFDLQPPTVIAFVKLLCSYHKMDDKITYLAMYLSELLLIDGEPYLSYLPSKLASASVALARYTLSEKAWPEELESTMGYNLKQLTPVVKKQNVTFRDSPKKGQGAAHEKYCKTKYHKVGYLKPLVLTEKALQDEC